MDTRITEYIDLMIDNSIIIKSYDKESIVFCDSSFDDYVFSEDLLISTLEISNDELLGYIEFYFNNYSCEINFDEFENIKSQLNDQTYFKEIQLNHCKFKNFEEELEKGFDEFKQAIAGNFNDIDKAFLAEITKNLKYSKSQLELFISTNRENALRSINQFMLVKIDFCNEAIRFLDYSTFIFTNTSGVKNNNIEEVKNIQAEVKLPKPKKQLDISTNLTQNQVVILFHFLRQLGYIGKEMPKNRYAEHIAELTGFAQEKIRQNLSHIDKDSQSLESVQFTEVDFSVVRRAMEKMITAIKTDSEEKFS